MTAESYKKEFNLWAKRTFRKWLLDAIENNDFESFKECVRNIGTEWHVARTVETGLKDDFIQHLWDVRTQIQNGTYTGWTESNYDAYSYESKICFLINPTHYKLIYDTNNRTSLNKIVGKNLSTTDWQEAVDSYYEEYHKGVTNEEEIFAIDFSLWNRK